MSNPFSYHRVVFRYLCRAAIIVDVFKEAGAAYTAYLLYVDTVVSDGVFDIQFKRIPRKDDPKVSGVAVYKVNDA
jgi:hypothetical protein